MIPYFELRTLTLGGVTLAPFGILVAVGVTVGILFAERRARALGLPEGELHAAVAWALVPGFLGSHLVVVLFYRPEGAERGLAGLLQFWNGMSSFGGFFGAALGLAVYFGWRRRPWLTFADVLSEALVLGWVFGRLGCTLVHDHVGRPSDFALAIRFPNGPRHDLGLDELLYTLVVLVPAVVLLGRRRRAPGTSLAVLGLLYAPARFLLDFLRNTDLPGAEPRTLGLTPAQFACLGVAVLGIHLLRRARRRPPPGARTPRRPPT